MVSKHDERMAKLRADLDQLPQPAAAKPVAEPTVGFQLRMPESLRAAFVAEAGRRSIATGRSVTAQQVILETLRANMPQAAD